MPKISVIIPVYNTEKYLRECLDSVVNQTLEDIEIICINDGSTDGSLAILEEYAEKDERIKVITKTNEGAGKARNVAIRNCLGEFVFFMDSDDYFPSGDVLETLYDKSVENNVNICGGDALIFSDKNRELRAKFPKNQAGYMHEKEGIIKYSDYQFDYGFSRFLFNREFLIKNKIFFPEYERFEDPPFFVNAMVTSGEFYAVNKTVYAYRKGISHIIWTKNKVRDFFSRISDVFRYANLYNLNVLKKYNLDRLNAHVKNIKKAKPELLWSLGMSLLKLIIKESVVRDYYFKKFIQCIFSVKNAGNKTHKIVTVMGIKIKIKRKRTKDFINVVMITDNNYVNPTIVAITSMALNKTKDEVYNINILTNELSEYNNKLLKSCGNDGIKISIMEESPVISKFFDIKELRHVSRAALLKFYIAELFPDMEKILYLDGDILVQNSLKELYNTDVTSYYAAVVKDILCMHKPKYLVKHGINNKYYFNSGVMLLNLKKLREDNIKDKFIENKLSSTSKFMDQDTFNAVIGHNVKYVSYKYNFLNYYFSVKTHKELSLFFGETVNKNENKTYKNCTILHLGGKYKPWKYDLGYLSKIYKKYWNKSLINEPFPVLMPNPEHKIVLFSEKIFSVTNSKNKKHKIVTVLGIKVKTKNKEKTVSTVN